MPDEYAEDKLVNVASLLRKMAQRQPYTRAVVCPLRQNRARGGDRLRPSYLPTAGQGV